MNHKCIVWTLATVAILFLVVKESKESDLDPSGYNVCSETRTRSNRLKRMSFYPYDYCRQFWAPMIHGCKNSGGYGDWPRLKVQRKETYIHYYCCPGWLRNGLHCSIRNPCPTGRENCTDFNIIYVPKPSLSYRNDSAVPKVEMVCSFDFPVWRNVSYLVEWYGRSTKPVKKDTWCVPDQPADAQNDCTRRQSSIVLPDHFALGDTVWCRLFMKFSTKKTNKWTATGKDSNQYYVGIEVSPRHVIVKECNVAENITVTLRPTVPILPTMNIPGSDSVVVSVLIPQKYKAQRRQAAVDKCQVELKTQDITRGKIITIRGICDNQQDQRQSFAFRFKPQTMSTSWSDVDSYHMPAVKITVDNTETRLCLTTTDPNLFTFDKRRYFYNEIGDYVMYSNEAKKVQVHVRLWMCSGQMTCVCGAAIREGKDVIVMSMCNKMKDSDVPTILRTFKRSPGSLSKGIQITKKISGSSLEQEVILSSGIRVSVERSGRSLDVRINAPSTDKGKVLGLCGNFNDDPEDDWNKGGDGKPHDDEKQFAASWRLKEGKSFFEVLPEQELEEQVEQGRSCYCGIEGETTQDERCDDNANLFTRIDATQIEVLNTQINDQSHFSMKRSVDSHWYSDDIIDHVERSYYVDDPHIQLAVNRIRKKRSTIEVISEDEATKYCKTQIEETKAGKACMKISETNLKNAMIQCVNDLKLSGDKTFAVLAFETMKYICEDTTLKNLSLYTHTASGDLMPPREVVKDLCPADCSGRGKCKNRTCICDEGYTALDCSMKVNSVPELLGIYNSGLCDIRERPCKKTNILGQNFIKSENLTCHVQEEKVYQGTWSPRGIPVTSQGKMTDLFGVQCNLPEPPTRLGDYEHGGTPAGRLSISISNDGFNTSFRRLRHLTYDSKCMNCSKSGKCEFKTDSCLIKGHCFAANEPNPRDWCQQCLPRVDHKTWTSRKNNQVPRFPSKTTYFALQGERLVIQLKATDPDNRPLTYSVLSSTATAFTLSLSGLFTWKVLSKENKKFTFRVTDECGAFDIIHVTVRILQCPCLNGGKCVPHPFHPRGSGSYQCQCSRGTGGERCLKVCSGSECPRGLAVKPIGTTKLEVKWNEPKDLQSVDYYWLKYGHTDKLAWKMKVPKTVTTKILTGLKKFENYRVTLTVMFSNGEKTTEAVAKTGEDVPDAAPVITDISPVRYDTMKVTWSPIPEDQRNGIIKGYKIYYKELLYNPRNKWEVFVVTGGDVTSTMVTGLKSFTEYCVKMSAFTNKGEYRDWGRKQCKIVKIPSLPIKVQAKAMSMTEVLLKFVKPVHSFPSNKVQVDYGKLKDELNMKKACYGSSCVIDNLERDTMYYFRVIGYVYQRGETPTFTKIKTSIDEVLKFRRHIK